MRIQDLVKGGGAQPLGSKVANIAEWSHVSEVSFLWPESKALKLLGF